ncbi:actinobacterial surface-anchored domain protein [[Clostridium] sordellii ATCC 9714]|nr:actinobacterial surface-anchored domain protein [[Clostridium] sordellii ATCC 9714] [Paeniclostridium sordellii ATCC 9714]
MAGVTATDTEDGNITKDIKVTGIVDTDKPGKYELTYTVTDKDGNTTTVKRTVIVNPKMVAINNIPVINGENKTIKVGDKFNPMTGVTAIDKEDGNITKDIKVIENTVDTSKPGTYKVVYEVTDSKGATATKTITVTVISNDKPVISGADNISIKEGTPFNPMAGVTATDTEDGNITKDIKVTGIVDTDKPGKYELTYTVTDKDGNTTTVKRTVIVNPKIVEINAIPVINAENKTIKVGDKFNPMTGVTATDKEDGNITKDIKVIKNTVDTSKPGTYKVIYEVTDSQGETSTKTITVTVQRIAIKII